MAFLVKLVVIFNFSSLLCFLQLLDIHYVRREIRLAEFEEFCSPSMVRSSLNWQLRGDVPARPRGSCVCVAHCVIKILIAR